MLDDRELLRRYVEDRSNDAFAELVNRYVDLVYSAALRKLNGDAHKAKDVAQAVFIKLATHGPSLPANRVLAGWLYTTAHNTASKAIRTEVRRRQREQEAQMIHDITATEAAPADWQQVRPLLDDAMHELNGPDRDAILLRFFQRRPFAEIGEKLGLSENAARMRVERALDKLHGLLGKRGIRSSSAAFGTLLAGEAIIAAPAGLAAGIAAGSLATLTFLTTMSTAKMTALIGLVGLSLTTNALLVVGLQDHAWPFFPSLADTSPASALMPAKNSTAGSGSEAVASRRSGVAALSTSAESAPARTTFELLLSKDPAVFAANLRAAGFSSPATRGAVNRLLRETEESHRLDVLKSVPLPPFWNTAESTAPTGPQLAEYGRMRAERAATFNRLFPEENEYYLLNLRRHYGTLPDDKLAQLDQIESGLTQVMQQFTARGNLPWDAELIAQLQKEARGQMEALLTPRELEEYNLRTSPTARALRELATFNPSEQEFRELYRLRSAYDERFRLTPGFTALGPEQIQARAQAQDELDARVRSLLGEDRYVEYARATDPAFQQAYGLMRQLNLPVANATATYRIQQETMQRAAQIRAASGQTPAERTEQLQQLAQEAEQRLTPLLTPAGLNVYRARGGAWLGDLARVPGAIRRP